MWGVGWLVGGGEGFCVEGDGDGYVGVYVLVVV